MRLRLLATTEELETKGGDLIEALARRLADYDPELGEALIKASRVKVPKTAAADNLQFKVLREIKDKTTQEYKRQLEGMLKDIGDVLEGRPLRKAFGDPPEKPEPGEEEEPEEKLEPGDYDPKTDDIVPEPEDEDEDEEDEEEEKSLTAGAGALAGSD